MTPGAELFDGVRGGSGGEDDEDVEARRRRFLRRRLTAAGAVLLVVVWASSLLSSGGSDRRPAGAADRGAVAAAALAHRDAAHSAEHAREEQAIQNALGYTSYVTAGSVGKREMALTFDDGPGPDTPQVIAVLRRLRVPATFFVVGAQVKDYGSYIPVELAGDFVIGDHTQDHSFMTQLSRPDQVAQLLKQVDAVGAYGAPFPHLFRPPYGAFNATTLEIAKKLKMLTVLWTIDTSDFRQPGVDSIVKKVIAGAAPGAIVLMHDAGGPRAQTVAALPRIIAGLRHLHYRLVTVPRLLADDPPLTAQQAPPSGGA